MGLLEEALRDTFSSRVAAPPVMDDVADRVIHRAGRVRRRRTVLVSAVTAVSVAIIGVGLVAAVGTGGPDVGVGAPSSGSPSATSAGPTAASVLPVDVFDGGQIHTANGTIVTLAGLGTVRRAWRVDEGFLVESSTTEKAMVWLVSSAGAHTLLASGESAIVSPGNATRPGPQIAWSNGGTLLLGTYAHGQVTGIVSTDGVSLAPQRVVGTGVVLAGTKTGGGLDTWDMWFPDKGRYKTTTDNPNGLSSVLGATVANDRIIGLYGGKPACLGELDPTGFTPVKSNCSVDLNLDDRIFPSPDGKWWAIIGPSGVALYDAEQVWTRAEPALTLPVVPSRAAVWLPGNESFVVVTSTEVLRVYVKDGRPYDSVPLPQSGLPGATAIPIPDLR